MYGRLFPATISEPRVSVPPKISIRTSVRPETVPPLAHSNSAKVNSLFPLSMVPLRVVALGAVGVSGLCRTASDFTVTHITQSAQELCSRSENIGFRTAKLIVKSWRLCTLRSRSGTVVRGVTTDQFGNGGGLYGAHLAYFRPGTKQRNRNGNIQKGGGPASPRSFLRPIVPLKTLGGTCCPARQARLSVGIASTWQRPDRIM